MKSSFPYFIRALRLPFAAASLLPFVFGSLIDRARFNFPGFIFGLTAALCTHLSANLMNDYADSRSGADWQDKRFFGFFGGSKLIQEGIFTESFYLQISVIFACLALASIAALAFILKNISVFGYYLIIIFLGWSYSEKPFQFSYCRLGEIIIFLLFGPALVMGGYFIQTGIFPDLRSFVLSLPFGFFTTAILYSNEIPDFLEDQKAGKATWVSFFGQERAFVLYYILILCAFSSIVLGFLLGYFRIFSIFAFFLVFPAMKAANILQRFATEKTRLLESSKLTVNIQVSVGIILVLGMLI